MSVKEPSSRKRLEGDSLYVTPKPQGSLTVIRHNTISISRQANLVAGKIRDAFVRYQTHFLAISRRARDRFGRRDWSGLQADATQRIELYSTTLDELVQEVTDGLEERLDSAIFWTAVKAVFSSMVRFRRDCEIAETFFNSVTRRIFTTVGVNNDVEFVHTDYDPPPITTNDVVQTSFPAKGSLAKALRVALLNSDLPWSVETVNEESRRVAEELQRQLAQAGVASPIESLELIKWPFFRGEFAYLVGRISCGHQTVPLVISVHHDVSGCRVDALLTRRDDVSLLFSFARSYFHVEVSHPRELVHFVHQLVPHKLLAEIYISIGYNRHGKTEFYRDLLGDLSGSNELFLPAPGPRGMVMFVFTVPSFPYVFKVIKDCFDYPKEGSRATVLDRYRMIFKRDRAGRLVDAQEFCYLELDRDRFDPETLEELLNVAAQTVSVVDDQVVIQHCYVQRRVVPLNMYLQEASPSEAREAVIDYGQTIKDLAASNVFPGDLLLKNFGVTRQKRVVFYDYDEVSLITDCNFRPLPPDDAFDYGPEHRVSTGPHDVFPEEFRYFLGLSEEWKELFLKHHGDLVELDFWLRMQRRLRAGEVLDIPPYSPERRIPAPRIEGDAPLPPVQATV